MEIRERGYDGSWALLAQYLAQYRQHYPVPKPAKPTVGRPAGSGKSAKPGMINTKLKYMLSAREACFIVLKIQRT